MQSKENPNPVNRSINFELPTKIFPNGSEPVTKLLKKSKPPRKHSRPKITTMCINNFCLLGYRLERNPSKQMGMPSMAGIQEVTDWLLESILTIIAHNMRITP